MISHVNLTKRTEKPLMAHTGPCTKLPSDVPFKAGGTTAGLSKTSTGDVEA